MVQNETSAFVESYNFKTKLDLPELTAAKSHKSVASHGACNHVNQA